MNKEDYLNVLEESFDTQLEVYGEKRSSKLVWVANAIFDFNTYDDALDEEFAIIALEVAQAITKGKTFEYIEDETRYKNYVLMCHIPFFANRLSWGSSIRGAFWDCWVCGENKGDYFSLDSPYLKIDEDFNTIMTFSREEWKMFMEALFEFCEKEAL